MIPLYDQIYTVDKSRLDYLIDEVSSETIKEIEIAPATTYEISPNKIASDIIHGFLIKWFQHANENQVDSPNQNEVLSDDIKKLVEYNKPNLPPKTKTWIKSKNYKSTNCK